MSHVDHPVDAIDSVAISGETPWGCYRSVCGMFDHFPGVVASERVCVFSLFVRAVLRTGKNVFRMHVIGSFKPWSPGQ